MIYSAVTEDKTMAFKILAIGDVFGKVGLETLSSRLRRTKRELGADFTVVNGENAAKLGITPDNARQIFEAGADVITLGNHALNQRKIVDYLDDEPYIVRPANWPSPAPGRGSVIYDTGGLRVAVVNLVGRVTMEYGPESPFTCADRVLAELSGRCDAVVVDFHAEATSEKAAMAYHLDGRAAVLFGTHTHVQTADERVFPGGLGYITDLGMTGASDSIIGTAPSGWLARFRGDMLAHTETAWGGARCAARCLP